MGFTWELRGTWDKGNPMHNMRILCVGIPTVGFAHAYYAWVFPRKICALLPTHKMRILCVGIPTAGFAHA